MYTPPRRLAFACFALVLAAVLSASGCERADAPRDSAADNARRYVEWSRFTDPGEQAPMFETLPDDFDELCEVVRQQMVHYRMLAQWEIARDEWSQLPLEGRYLFPAAEILAALRETEPGTLSADRPVMNRLRASCSNESIFLASALRSQKIPARVRKGYFKNIYQGSGALRFWMNVDKYERGGQNPEGTRSFTEQAIRNNNLIEHWICEYWDGAQGRWRLLDVRTEYPQAYGIDAPKHLPAEYFQYAWEAWQGIGDPVFNPDRYSGDAWDGDGRSHIRRQLLLDFYSLLNREAADVFVGLEPGSQGETDRAFLRVSYSELSPLELQELDALAELMSGEPTVEKLVAFYRQSETLKLPSLEADPRSFLADSSP